MAKIEEQTKKDKISLSSIFVPYQSLSGDNYPWSSEDVDRYEIEDVQEYRKTINMSRFFYRRDPIAGTVVNKIIEMGITEIKFYKGTLGINDFKIFEGIKQNIQDFMEDCALEYLTTGLVVPEVSYTTVGKDIIKEYGIKKMSVLTLPTEMWVRDSSTIKINRVFGYDSYFVEIPDDLIFFVKTKGKYPDGTKDEKLYLTLQVEYPELVTLINSGEKYVLLDNKNIIERKKLSSDKYPIPYLYPALESLKHKRNLRKMDYSIASRVISAIQLITLGDKDFPLLEDDQAKLDELQQKMLYRDGTGRNVERIFQLFGNHTLKISWIFPPTEALLSDTKYKDINLDILFGLGFPRILINGETERTGTSDPEYALLSPVKTMENMRSKFMRIIKDIVNSVCQYNAIAGRPIVKFLPINLHDFTKYFEMLTQLYQSGNLSRDSYTDVLGYDINTEFEKRKEEQELIKKYGLEEFSPLPHSNTPNKPGQEPEKEEEDKKEDSEENKENEE